jgi:RimJ/RimL family protein N-acetyltransferase
LLQKPGIKDKGGGPGGEYWAVMVDGARAGEVFVNVIDEAPLGVHASLQIYLNEAAQGKGIGRVAYRKAADASLHGELYLHMRKSNLASRLAAEAAGFVDVALPGIVQLILKRARASA